MPIPEAQLVTWSHQGSVTQSADTYATIKAVLEAAGTPYANRNYQVFLQGSYGNDTNIYAESDVDVVIRLNDCFQSDLQALSPQEKDEYERVFADAQYCFPEFKGDVLATLTTAFGRDATPGSKAITIEASGARRKADVIVAIQFRRYYAFKSPPQQRFEEGICFWSKKDLQIINYPQQHSVNCTAKHKRTAKWFKPVVRMVKNLRSRLVDDGLLEEGAAPSYYIEGLLYNVPDDLYGGSYQASFVNAVEWIQRADKTKLVCANEQYYLLRENSPVTWRASQCETFLASAVDLWENW